MSLLGRFWVTALLLASCVSTSYWYATAASAFQTPQTATPLLLRQQTSRSYPATSGQQPSSSGVVDVLRGGKGTEIMATTPAASMSEKAKDPAAKAAGTKKVRIQAFDSMRFFLIINIVLGHFIMFAQPSTPVLKFCSQHNVLVGAFFALSGYVTAYTTTENGVRAVSPKVLETPKQQWILSKVFGYYPLHLVTLLLFSPVFLYSDVFYSGWPTALLHGAMSITMTQAWAPGHAEIWNAPTWFLSALTFATATLPYCLPAIAGLNVTQLVKTGWWIFMAYLLPKLGYAYDFNVWTMAEGVTAPKLHPNLQVFNTLRFSPVFAVAEVLLGIIACRIVMLDGTEGKPSRTTNALSTAVPLLGMVGLMVARAVGKLDMSDMLFRGILFVPLFLRFLMAAHRNTVKSVQDPLLTLLNNKVLVALGNLAFPIFIVHGPIGQIFFKKIIANKLWGKVLMGPTNFAIYLATMVATAFVLQKTVLQNNAVNKWSKNTVDTLSKWM